MLHIRLTITAILQVGADMCAVLVQWIAQVDIPLCAVSSQDQSFSAQGVCGHVKESWCEGEEQDLGKVVKEVFPAPLDPNLVPGEFCSECFPFLCIFLLPC